MFRLNAAAAALAAVVASTTGATAQEWNPPGPIRMIIGFQAGGGADTHMRLIAEAIEENRGWEIIPENLPGRGGVNAARELLDEPADGSAIAVLVAETLGYSARTSPGSGVEPSRFTPITTTAGHQTGFVANAASGWTDLGAVLEAARAGEPIRMGALSALHDDIIYLLGEANDIEFNVVPVRGGGRAALNALAAGDIDVGIVAGAQARGVASGELVNLASTIGEPLRLSPDAPLLSEYGVDFTLEGYFMVAGPADMPDEARAAIASAVAEATASGPAAEFIGRAFGGPLLIAGDDLDALIARTWETSAELLEAVSE